MSFQATVRHNGDVAVVDLSGRLILGEASTTLRDTVAALIGEGEKKILLNLTDVSHLDSAGLGEMFAVCASVTRAGGEIKLVTPAGKIHDQMEVTKLSAVCADYQDETSAAGSFRRAPTKV
jgi:anti-sigma B factor antagonist